MPGWSRCLIVAQRSTIPWTQSGKQRHERPRPQYRTDAGEPAVRGKRRCRMHGGAPGSGAPRGNQNARRHGLFTKVAIAERKQIQAMLGEARKLLQAMK